MDEEEEDRVLLTTLGVTSANPEDIERDILDKVVHLPHLFSSFFPFLCVYV